MIKLRVCAAALFTAGITLADAAGALLARTIPARRRA